MGKIIAWILIMAVIAGPRLYGREFDLTLPDADRKTLNSFGQHELAKADKLYQENKHEPASVSYEAFLLDFPKSAAEPYAMFQRARCIQLTGNTTKAIALYEELIEKFPALVRYAAPALYFTAECHLQDHDDPKAIKYWTELASDKDYRQHPLAAGAIRYLAPRLMEMGQTEEALKFYRQGAVDYRTANPSPAYRCLEELVDYYTVVTPNEPELRKLFKDADGFEREAKPLPAHADVTQERLYWQRIWERVAAKAKTFPILQNENKRKLLTYWIEAFKGRFPEWKEYQDQLAAFIKDAAAASP